MRPFAILLLTFLGLVSMTIAVNPADGPAAEPDLAGSLPASRLAYEHARKLEQLLSLPPNHFTRVEPADDDLDLRALVHMDEPSSRYVVGCRDPRRRQECMLISPYQLVRVYPGGAEEVKRVLMMLKAENGEAIRPAGIVHLQGTDEVDLWNRVVSLAQETKQSLVSQYGRRRFLFPSVPI